MQTMPIERTWDSDLHIVRRFSEPTFQIAPATFVNKHLMPWRVRRSCGWVWDVQDFPAHDILIRRYEDVFIAGQGLVIRALDRAIYQASVTQHSEYDLAVGLQDVRDAEHAGSVLRIDDPCIICTKPGGDNYGHWLNEMLPRASFGRELALPNTKYLVPAANARLAAVIGDSLRLLGVPARCIVATTRPVWAAQAYGVYGLTAHGSFMSPRVLDCVDEMKAKVAAARPRKLYVTRDQALRHFSDEAGVRRVMRERGYRVIDPAKIDLKTQIRRFKSATDIVGVMGAGMSNIAFAPAGAKITIFAPASMSDNFYWFLAGLRGQTYREIRCPSSPIRKGRARWDHDLDVSPEEVAAHAAL